MSDVLHRAREWLAEDPDAGTRAELEALIERGGDELARRFHGKLEFGTAGLRGVLGAGPQRMNRVVVRRAPAGLADYLLMEVADAGRRGVVIGYDGRHGSQVFAEDAARVLAGRGIRAYLSTTVLPTPVTAFAVLDRGAAAGIMVTASHNPPEYNGYKVYWKNGAQIIPPHDGGISNAIDRVGRTDRLPLPELDDARRRGLIVDLGAEVGARYLERVRGLSARPDAAHRAPITIVYTPLHGVGAHWTEAALAGAGFTRVHTVAAQREPDPDFPTVRFPNPEEKGAMDQALALAAEVSADLVLANDPDADRLAVAVPEGDGYRMLSGDQIGVLLADYLLAEGPGGRRLVATTIVSSQMLGRMAAAAGVDFVQTLTGFKWIANAAMTHKAATGSRFVMGYEEALGYTVGELVRDKDGVGAAALFAELVAFERGRDRTVWDRLADLYHRHGLHLTEQVSLTLPGHDGLTRMAALMQRFRDMPPHRIGDHEIRERHDLLFGSLDLPPSDVLIYFLEGGPRIIMRPSGTEPKLKCYYEVAEPLAPEESLAGAMPRARAALTALRDAHQAMLT